MCMLFVYINPRPSDDDYLLVLANVRDEFFYRPSRICHFWERNPNILGGMDFEEGKEGGTWLAMNTNGQVASLLNVVRPVNEINGCKKDRGFLVVNYLESELVGHRYLSHLRKDADNYHPFLLVTLDVRPAFGEVIAASYTNVNDDDPVTLGPGVHVFGNSSPSKPWKKVDAARYKFSKVIERKPKPEDKESIMKDIFQLLADDTPYYPDKQLEADIPDSTEEDEVKKLSAIFINDLGGIYGSRTHTIIMIDSQGQVDFVERTMREPIEASSGINWITTRLQFSIENPEHLVSRL